MGTPFIKYQVNFTSFQIDFFHNYHIRKIYCIEIFNLGYGFHADIITCLAFHPSLPVALTGSADNTACLSNYSSGKVIYLFHYQLFKKY